MIEDIYKKKRYERRRESSYDRSGANSDSISIPSNASHQVQVLKGPGIIKHIWMTVAGKDISVYKNLKLKISFDGLSPQVFVPLADFFLFGHGLLVDVNSLPIQVTRQARIEEEPYRGSMNCTFPMPFSDSAEISFINDSDESVVIYYYVDWERHQAIEDPVLYFHATLNEELTEPTASYPFVPHGQYDDGMTNLTGTENYKFLEITGYEGHYVGIGLSVQSKADDPGKWWEGDDMFFIDGESWPPRIHGTGTEDYFNLAWGFHKVDCRPEYGITYLNRSEQDKKKLDGKFSAYRFHFSDPIPFEHSILATVEHGHANDCRAHYRSVAYWYGRKK